MRPFGGCHGSRWRSEALLGASGPSSGRFYTLGCRTLWGLIFQRVRVLTLRFRWPKLSVHEIGRHKLLLLVVNGASLQKQPVLFSAETPASSCVERRAWTGPRSAHLQRAASMQRSQTDCWRSDSRSGQTSGEASSRGAWCARPAWEIRRWR